MDEQTSQLQRGWPHLLGLAVVIALVIWFSGWTGLGQPSAAGDALWVLITSIPLVIAWLAAAMGCGWLICQFLARSAHDQLIIQVGTGIAALLTIDEICGVLGLLQIGGSIGAWIIIAIGIGLLGIQIVLRAKSNAANHAPHGMIWIAAPSIAALLVASCSAPGVLWASEFGGYDALSYHLQLPKEWLALGRIQPLEHNVYSFLPGYLEAAYYHVAILKGDAISAAYACQLLHAALTMLTAFAIGRFGSRIWNPAIGAAAAVLFLGTPWVIVVGSLAYNEIVTILILIVGLSAIRDEGFTSVQRGLILGIVAGAACGAKLTSIGMVIAPILALVLINYSPRQWLRIAGPMLLTGSLTLAPYFVRNFVYAGNPVFPFATDLFGEAHWSSEQIAAWRRGHVLNASVSVHVTECWNQFLRYGIGVNPYAFSEPWKPQWFVLPWLGICGILCSLAFGKSRRNSISFAIVLMMQLLFWCALTHMKSRFLLPSVVPLALGTCDAASALRSVLNRRMATIISAFALTLWSIQPVLIFQTEARGAPAIAIGAVDVMTGNAMSASDRMESGTVIVALNYVLPPKTKILGIGFATPFYVRADLVYNTTWDRSILSHLMRESPDNGDAWARELQQKGFTHLIVNETMLAIWERSRWNDPVITVDRVRAFVEQHATPLYQFPDGSTIYALRFTEKTP